LVAQHNPEDEVEFLRSLAEAAKDEHIIVNAKQSVNGWLMKMRYGELALKQPCIICAKCVHQALTASCSTIRSIGEAGKKEAKLLLGSLQIVRQNTRETDFEFSLETEISFLEGNVGLLHSYQRTHSEEAGASILYSLSYFAAGMESWERLCGCKLSRPFVDGDEDQGAQCAIDIEHFESLAAAVAPELPVIAFIKALSHQHTVSPHSHTPTIFAAACRRWLRWDSRRRALPWID